MILPGLIDQHLHPVLAALTLTTDVIAPERWVMPRHTFEAGTVLAAGEVVAIMPQGTIPRGPAFFEPKLKGRWGAARLAHISGAPVIHASHAAPRFGSSSPHRSTRRPSGRSPSP